MKKISNSLKGGITVLTVSLLTALAVFTSCANEDTALDMKGMFSPQGEVIGTRFLQSMEYNETHEPITIDMHSDDYTIYLCSDSHITRKAHKNLDYFMHMYENAPQPKMAIHLGDLIDAQNNYECAYEILNYGGRTIDDTLFITPGNHDIYFKQWPIYHDYFKSSVYWFDTSNNGKKLDLFVCLDSAEGELGPDQIQWLRQLLADKSGAGYRHIIVFTHTHLWKLDGSQGHTSNYALEATYELTSLLSQYKVEYVWSGHQHARQRVTFKGVTYLVLNATKDDESHQSYMIARMGSNIAYEYVDYPEQ